MLRIAFPLLLLCASLPAQTTSTFTVNATATASATPGGFAIVMAGTGTLTPFGTAQVSSSFTISTQSGIVGTTPVTAALVMVFGGGDVLLGQFIVPAGYLIPQLGQTASAMASFTITGGSGRFVNASGVFQNLSVSATNGNSIAVQASGSGTILTPSAHVVGTPSYTRLLRALRVGRWMGDNSHADQQRNRCRSGAGEFLRRVRYPSTLPLDFPQGSAPTSASTYHKRLIQEAWR